MDLELAKANIRRVFEEGFNEGRLEAIDEYIACDAVDHHPFSEEEPDFPSHLKGVILMIRAAIPDLSVRVEDIFGEGDRVAVRTSVTGTHTGAPLFGLPARGAAIQVEQFHIVAVGDDNKGRRHWANAGVERMMAQVSAASATPPVPAR